MSIWGIIKLVVLSIGFVFLVTYMTVEPPKKIVEKQINLIDLPKAVQVVGVEDVDFATKSIVKKDSIIFVGNFESIVLAPKFYEMLEEDDKKRLVIVSNVSDAPWFIKKWKAHDQNMELKKNLSQAWIFDQNGAMKSFLQIKSSNPLKYYVYKVHNDGIVYKIHESQVPQGTIDGLLSEDDMKRRLDTIVKKLNDKKEIK